MAKTYITIYVNNLQISTGIHTITNEYIPLQT